LISARPFFINGPEDMRPLNMATTSPVALTIKVSIEVKAITIGVKSTPPPIPAITATMAMIVLMRKEPKTMDQIDVALRTSVPVTFEKTPIAVYPSMAKRMRIVNSGVLLKTEIIYFSPSFSSLLKACCLYGLQGVIMN
jgi:hypothetical protein